MSILKQAVAADNGASKSNGKGNIAKKPESKRSSRIFAVRPKASSETTSASSKKSLDNTADFIGEVDTDNALPSPEVLHRVAEVSILDKDGKSRPFKSLYSGPNVTKRVLVIFVRHFFCGNCQEYLRTLSKSITTDSLLQLPVPAFIAVIGCGSPSLIPMYQEATQCPFPIYADPTKGLYDELGMIRTLTPGSRPDYQRRSTLFAISQSVIQGLKQIKKGLVTKAGDPYQIGGEFLFEPMEDVAASPSPLVTPTERSEEKRVTWCHRMRTTRDHAEIPEIREVLGFDDVGVSGRNKKRWTKALESRKGTGLSGRSSMTLDRKSTSLERKPSDKQVQGTTNGSVPTEINQS